MAGAPHSETKPLALIVVTDPVMHRICRDTLGKAGFSVTNSVESGADAIVRAREQHPDVILLSQQLSDVPAAEAVKWLRENSESANTPIIILGGKPSGAKVIARVIVLPRPVTPGQLQHALTQALDHKPGTSGAVP